MGICVSLSFLCLTLMKTATHPLPPSLSDGDSDPSSVCSLPTPPWFLLPPLSLSLLLFFFAFLISDHFSFRFLIFRALIEILFPPYFCSFIFFWSNNSTKYCRWFPCDQIWFLKMCRSVNGTIGFPLIESSYSLVSSRSYTYYSTDSHIFIVYISYYPFT